MVAPASTASLTRLYHNVTAAEGWSALTIALTVPVAARAADNSVHPAWRSAAAYALVSGGWNWQVASHAQAAR
jgi:hypothetical protein